MTSWCKVDCGQLCFPHRCRPSIAVVLTLYTLNQCFGPRCNINHTRLCIRFFLSCCLTTRTLKYNWRQLISSSIVPVCTELFWWRLVLQATATKLKQWTHSWVGAMGYVIISGAQIHFSAAIGSTQATYMPTEQYILYTMTAVYGTI